MNDIDRAVLAARRLREAAAAYNAATREAIDLNMTWLLTISLLDGYNSPAVMGDRVTGLAVGNIIQRVNL